jgi:hypothetical protein
MSTFAEDEGGMRGSYEEIHLARSMLTHVPGTFDRIGGGIGFALGSLIRMFSKDSAAAMFSCTIEKCHEIGIFFTWHSYEILAHVSHRVGLQPCYRGSLAVGEEGRRVVAKANQQHET